jgi:hypothetical protein
MIMNQAGQTWSFKKIWTVEEEEQKYDYPMVEYRMNKNSNPPMTELKVRRGIKGAVRNQYISTSQLSSCTFRPIDVYTDPYGEKE